MHRYELLKTHVIQHESFRLVRPMVSFKTFANGHTYVYRSAPSSQD